MRVIFSSKEFETVNEQEQDITYKTEGVMSCFTNSKVLFCRVQIFLENNLLKIGFFII